MKQATSFDDVSYFKNQFRGDLIITEGRLDYFQHTNVAAAKTVEGGPGGGEFGRSQVHSVSYYPSAIESRYR